ncbi:MAG: Holliday junction branch migration DNA helicase RuvB [Planctomycetia bacterium]|nr:Holliday junction branch migration DNA helicase RuvB [Planctomycetia bacterium]
MARVPMYGSKNEPDPDPVPSNEDKYRFDEYEAKEKVSSEEDLLLRPQRMFEMVGQREVYARIEIAIQAARKRGETLGHILFDGPPGLGKTTFATCIPHEMGVDVRIANGATLRAPKDIIPYLSGMKKDTVLFIDEIHRMQKSVEEFLYPAMEDFRIDFTTGDGLSARTINLKIEPFTLIGATTRTGLLSAPLRDRFQVHEHLDFYPDEDLAEIIHRNTKKLHMRIDDESALEIARRSRGTPRLANNRLRWVRDYSDARADGQVSLELTRAALEMQGIDVAGLDAQDRKYLLTILKLFQGRAGRGVGVDTLAHTMNIAKDTIIDDIEPFLLRSEMLIRSQFGRMITAKGIRHLGFDPDDYDFRGTGSYPGSTLF